MARNTHQNDRTRLPDAGTLHQLYYVQGKTIAQIAKHYHCRASLVLRAMNEAGITRRRTGRSRAPLPDWDAAKLQQLVKIKGLPYVRAFAKSHGVNRVKLAALLGERPLPRGQRKQQVLLDHDQSIRSAYNAGTPINALAKQYGCSRRAIGYSLDRTSRNE